MNKKEHCKGCVLHSQGRKDTKYRNWCSKFSTVALTVNEAPIPAATTQEIRQNDYTIKNVPSIALGNVYPTSPCMGSSQVGGSGVGFSIGVGTSWTDDECGIRETNRSFNGLGLKDDALAILCTSKYAAAAPSCAKP